MVVYIKFLRPRRHVICIYIWRREYVCPIGTIYQDLFIYIEICVKSRRFGIIMTPFSSRFIDIFQDLFIYIKVYLYTSRFIFCLSISRFIIIMHQVSCISVKISLHQDSYNYIEIVIGLHEVPSQMGLPG